MGIFAIMNQVLQRIPLQMPIPKLPSRLVRILSDFRTQASLRMGCNAVVKADCLTLLSKLQRNSARGVITDFRELLFYFPSLEMSYSFNIS